MNSLRPSVITACVAGFFALSTVHFALPSTAEACAGSGDYENATLCLFGNAHQQERSDSDGDSDRAAAPRPRQDEELEFEPTPTPKLEFLAIEYLKGDEIDLTPVVESIDARNGSIQGCFLLSYEASQLEDDQLGAELQISITEGQVQVGAVDFDDRSSQVLPVEFAACLSRQLQAIKPHYSSTNEGDRATTVSLKFRLYNEQ
jgi:hypothetical protein